HVCVVHWKPPAAVARALIANSLKFLSSRLNLLSPRNRLAAGATILCSRLSRPAGYFARVRGGRPAALLLLVSAARYDRLRPWADIETLRLPIRPPEATLGQAFFFWLTRANCILQGNHNLWVRLSACCSQQRAGVTANVRIFR